MKYLEFSRGNPAFLCVILTPILTEADSRVILQNKTLPHDPVESGVRQYFMSGTYYDSPDGAFDFWEN